jgi:hypothetical protein
VRDGAPAAFLKARVVPVAECASHAPVLAAIGPAADGKGSREQSLARELYPRLEEEWLMIVDRNFYAWQEWCAAQDAGRRAAVARDLLASCCSSSAAPFSRSKPTHHGSIGWIRQ